MNNISFANPEYFYLLLLIPPICIWYILQRNKLQAPILFSEITPDKYQKTYKNYLLILPFVLKIFGLIFLILALTRPQSTSSWENTTTEGIDIVLAMDISGSMLAEDLKPNRLEAAKEVATDFIAKRVNDRIGLVVFSGESFTQCPLTTDHSVLVNLFKDIKSGMIADGTAIGMGLATAVNRLKESDAISKVIILLTDGVNNQGLVAPLTAAEIAQKFGIRVYTIGVGTHGYAPYPFQTPFGIQYQDVEVQIDENTLQDIANITDGKYFRATDNKSLKEIYLAISQLEKSKIETTEYNKRKEEFLPFALIALGLLVISFVLQSTLLKSIP